MPRPYGWTQGEGHYKGIGDVTTIDLSNYNGIYSGNSSANLCQLYPAMCDASGNAYTAQGSPGPMPSAGIGSYVPLIVIGIVAVLLVKRI
jgi:hypothetical protein